MGAWDSESEKPSGGAGQGSVCGSRKQRSLDRLTNPPAPAYTHTQTHRHTEHPAAPARRAPLDPALLGADRASPITKVRTPVQRCTCHSCSLPAWSPCPHPPGRRTWWSPSPARSAAPHWGFLLGGLQILTLPGHHALGVSLGQHPRVPIEAGLLHLGGETEKQL